MICSTLLLLAGCSLDAGPAREIAVSGAAAWTDSDRRVVSARLDAFTPRGWKRAPPRYSYQTRDGQLIVQASAAPPSDAETRYLLSRQGRFRVGTDGGVPWFSERNVVDAVATMADKEAGLTLRLDAEGTARVARLSAGGRPVSLVATLDGEPLMRAMLTQPIPDGRLQINTPRPPQEMFLLAELLKSGALSFVPSNVEVRPLEAGDDN